MRKSEPDANIDATQLLLTKSVTVRGVQIGSKEMLEDLVRFINKKKLRMPIDRVFNFNYKDIQHAFAYLESRKHIGKVCIRMPD
ncbi:hypothetical protein EV182_005096 [Spiromyces aspiralis]|uniref:Uncharacterized protein n=1 Tax=Spiromyces aspiralis TaxID=68401 RepID=A0ACC1HHX2_9FUNG|nr:hypothetical protein EV182_005096 [Spiromyces aspiralis]